MTSEFLLTRVSAPRDIELHDAESDADRIQLGGGQGWFWGVTGTFAALAAPRSFASVPAAPTQGARHEDALGYWTALHNLLLYRLGWSRPDRGLRSWYEAGFPTEDPTLALIAEVWHRERRLDGYLAWLLRHPRQFLGSGSWEALPIDTPDALPQRWEKWIRETENVPNPNGALWSRFDSSGDSLHLTTSGGQSVEQGNTGRIGMVDKITRRATFTNARADDWYATLAAMATNLPDIGNRSWHVDVYVKPIGFMGTYRRSRVTGLWFTGKHSLHTTGN